MSQTEALEAQNTRLRELYENVVGNRERFGWTIDHLLECEEALRTVEARVEALEAQRDALREQLDDLKADHAHTTDTMNRCNAAAYDYRQRFEKAEDAVARLEAQRDEALAVLNAAPSTRNTASRRMAEARRILSGDGGSA